MAYDIEYSPDSIEHLGALSARERAIVFDAVENQLLHQPNVATRNRKPMRPNPVAPWELRVGDLRVYYDVTDDPRPLVSVRAVGVKVHNVLRIGGEEVSL